VLLILLQLRHPNVLAFKDSLEVQEKGQTVLYLVTEAVRPLAMVLQELHLSGHHRYGDGLASSPLS
jgi:SCY1-like protein 1